MSLSHERLLELLTYDPMGGRFYRRKARPGRTAGEVAGCLHQDGYIAVKVDGRSYMAHRLAWFYVTGKWPPVEIDHVNRDRSDNRWCNLREATRSQNQQNLSRRKDNPSGYPGVTFDTAARRWRARISVGGKQHFLGHFDDLALAASAYRSAKQSLHAFNPQVPG